jgi:hypothetical protein
MCFTRDGLLFEMDSWTHFHGSQVEGDLKSGQWIWGSGHSVDNTPGRRSSEAQTKNAVPWEESHYRGFWWFARQANMWKRRGDLVHESWFNLFRQIWLIRLRTSAGDTGGMKTRGTSITVKLTNWKRVRASEQNILVLNASEAGGKDIAILPDSIVLLK